MERAFKNFELDAVSNSIHIKFSDRINKIEEEGNIDIRLVINGAKDIIFGASDLVEGKLPQQFHEGFYDKSNIKKLPWNKKEIDNAVGKIKSIVIDGDYGDEWFDMAWGETGADIQTQVVYHAAYIFYLVDRFFTVITEWGNLWRALSLSFEMQAAYERLAIHVRDRVLKTSSEMAAHAVSHRGDQILKPGWQEHVRKCLEQGLAIRNINDLLGVRGYDPELAAIPFPTLKKWAKEACPELKFKPGRPS